jgi:dTDP-4-dehydrorhamnose reductase
LLQLLPSSEGAAVRSALRLVTVLIIGATGQVGAALGAEARREHAGDVVLASRRSHAGLRVELGMPESVDGLLDAVRPAHVFLAAAVTNVAWCEANEDEAFRINVAGTAAVAEACSRIDATLVFFSTDYVFDGADGPYVDDAETRPINVYGRHKLEAEKVVRAAADRNIVIRTCQVFGADNRRANFVLRTVDTIRSGREVAAATDMYGTPTYADDLAVCALALADGQHAGVWHVAGPTFLSRYDLAIRTAESFSLSKSLIVPVVADQFSDGVDRPRMAGLLPTKLRDVEQCRLRSLEDALNVLARLETYP